MTHSLPHSPTTSLPTSLTSSIPYSFNLTPLLIHALISLLSHNLTPYLNSLTPSLLLSLTPSRPHSFTTRQGRRGSSSWGAAGRQVPHNCTFSCGSFSCSLLSLFSSSSLLETTGTAEMSELSEVRKESELWKTLGDKMAICNLIELCQLMLCILPLIGKFEKLLIGSLAVTISPLQALGGVY